MLSTPNAPNAVDTIEDIIRILREQPEVREAVRREILTPELLELPEKVAQIIKIQEQILDRLDGHDRKFEEHGEKLDEHSRNLRSLNIKVSRLEGLAAFQAAERRYALIAMEMGLDEPRMLSLVEIARMAMNDKASEYTESQLESFRNCDIIIAARNPDADECYVAVQVSTTVDHGDISRAINHAKMATRFTDRPAYPAVVGFSRADIAEQRLASGSVHWHRMPSRAMNPR